MPRRWCPPGLRVQMGLGQVARGGGLAVRSRVASQRRVESIDRIRRTTKPRSQHSYSRFCFGGRGGVRDGRGPNRRAGGRGRSSGHGVGIVPTDTLRRFRRRYPSAHNACFIHVKRPVFCTGFTWTSRGFHRVLLHHSTSELESEVLLVTSAAPSSDLIPLKSDELAYIDHLYLHDW